MYEKVVNYFEKNLCVENMYFRKHHLKWIFGLIGLVIIELIINYILSNLIDDLLMRNVTVITIDLIIAIATLIMVYVIPLWKIFKGKVNSKTKRDWLGLLMREENLSTYREIEIKKWNDF